MPRMSKEWFESMVAKIPEGADVLVGRSSPVIHPSAAKVMDLLGESGGVPFLVGGAVRDQFLGRMSKDIDIECYQITSEMIESVLTEAGYRVDAVGRSFGVLKVTDPDSGETFDVSLPRSDNKVTDGHRGFVVTTDPFMSSRDASARRDFTINAMMLDQAGELVDHFGGAEDLKDGVLRHVSRAFSEDPLRVLRGCQFAARFNMTMADETVDLCRTLIGEMFTLPKERLWEEWKKLLVKGKKPSAGLQLMVRTGAIEVFPEIKALLNVPQDPQWHPEGQDDPLGSLWVHNCMVTDAAVRVLDEDGVTDEEERLIITLAAFCHDLGKPAMTVFDNGRWRSHAHEEAGEAPTRSFLTRIGAPPAVIEAVVPLVMNHLKPFHFGRDKASPSAIRRLALKVPLVRLCQVARADFLGRTTPEAMACEDSRTIEETAWLLDRASTLKVRDAAPVGILLGRHLIERGMKPGREMGEKLKAAFSAQLDGEFEDLPGAIAWLDKEAA